MEKPEAIGEVHRDYLEAGVLHYYASYQASFDVFNVDDEDEPKHSFSLRENRSKGSDDFGVNPKTIINDKSPWLRLRRPYGRILQMVRSFGKLWAKS